MNVKVASLGYWQRGDHGIPHQWQRKVVDIEREWYYGPDQRHSAPVDLAVTHNGRFWYGINVGSGTLLGWRVQADGQLTFLGKVEPIPTLRKVTGVTPRIPAAPLPSISRISPRMYAEC